MDFGTFETCTCIAICLRMFPPVLHTYCQHHLLTFDTDFRDIERHQIDGVAETLPAN